VKAFGRQASGVIAGGWLLLSGVALAQTAPRPSRVRPPIIVPPTGGGRIAIPKVPAGAQVPIAPMSNNTSRIFVGILVQY